MSQEHVTGSKVLARLSEDVVGPYKAYREALHYRHELSGVTREALLADAEETKAYGHFVTKAVGLLPPVQINRFEVYGRKKMSTSNLTCHIPPNVAAFRTEDSVEAEALWTSLVWDGPMPYYVIGNNFNSKNVDNTLALVLPPITLASEENRRSWLRTREGKMSGYLERKLGNAVFTKLNEAEPTFTYETKVNSGFSTRLDNRTVKPSSIMRTNQLGVNVANSAQATQVLRRFNEQFLYLADGEVTPIALEEQNNRLRHMFNRKAGEFVLGYGNLPIGTPTTSNIRIYETSEQITGQQMVEMQIAERLTVLAVRFGKLDEYSSLLNDLMGHLEEIRGGQLLPEGSNNMAYNNFSENLAEHIVIMLRQAQNQEELKQSVVKRVGHFLGLS